MELNAKVGEPEGFGCTECKQDINMCDRCHERFDYLEQEIHCDSLNHYCGKCVKALTIKVKLWDLINKR